MIIFLLLNTWFHSDTKEFYYSVSRYAIAFQRAAMVKYTASTLANIGLIFRQNSGIFWILVFR